MISGKVLSPSSRAVRRFNFLTKRAKIPRIIGGRLFFPVEAQGREGAQHGDFQQGLNREVGIGERGGKRIIRPAFRRMRPHAGLEVARIGGRHLEERPQGVENLPRRGRGRHRPEALPGLTRAPARRARPTYPGTVFPGLWALLGRGALPTGSTPMIALTIPWM